MPRTNKANGTTQHEAAPRAARMPPATRSFWPRSAMTESGSPASRLRATAGRRDWMDALILSSLDWGEAMLHPVVATGARAVTVAAITNARPTGFLIGELSRLTGVNIET